MAQRAMTASLSRSKRMWGVFTAKGAMTGYRPRFHKAEAQGIVDNSNYEHPGNPPFQVLPLTCTWTSPVKRRKKAKVKK